MEQDIETMSVKQLKEFITSKGGSHADCLEKADLKTRALQLKLQNNNDDDFEDISSSDEEEEEAPAVQQQGKRYSVFRAKKFMTSKLVSGTSTGRATIMKVLGQDGDEVVQALQSICCKLTNEKTAKEMKKDAIRFLLKAYNLLKENKITIESTKSIQTTGQMLGEMFVREANKPTVRPTSPQALATCSLKLREACVQIMSPHLQPKNRDRLSELLKFFATETFFQALLSRKDMEEEKMVLARSTSELLLPFQPLLAGERERAKYERSKQLLRALQEQQFDTLMDFPQFTMALQGFLELELGLTPKHVLRFFKSVDDFEKTTSKSLMRDRGPKIVNRFLLETSEFSMTEALNAKLLGRTVAQAQTESECNLGTFADVVKELKRLLRADFDQQFVKTRDYQELKQQVKKEIVALEAVLIADGVL